MPELTHANISCYVQTRAANVKNFTRSRLYDMQTRREGETTTLSCYLASKPGRYFRFMCHHGPLTEANKRAWDMDSDQLLRMYMDGSTEPLQEVDIDKNASMEYNPCVTSHETRLSLNLQ